MTREELEEARQLLAECRDGLCTDRSVRVWFLEHASELLSLAEEARWRSVTEEPPQTNSLILIAHPRPTGYLGRDGKWVAHGKFLDSHDYPKHWRPLPKGPER